MFWDNFLFSFSRIETVIVRGGCTKYVQAPDVVWNEPFKGKIQEMYDDWLANGKDEYTAAGKHETSSKESCGRVDNQIVGGNFK